MAPRKVPVRPAPSGKGSSAPAAEPPARRIRATKASLAVTGVNQISMQDLERLKARSRELMGLIIAAQHRS